jgi:UDP-glucose 4-epimerase
MSILVTGVAGFIGSHVARRCQAAGHHVIGVDDLSTGHRRNIPEGVEFIEADLADRDAVARLPPCERILHLAGQSSGEISFDDPVSDLHKNTISTLNLIRYGIDNRAGRLVYASSMSVYGDTPDAPIAESRDPRPLSCYGVGKLASEGYLRVYQRQLPYVAMRMFNVYGPGQDLQNLRQGMVSIFVAQAVADGRVEVKGSLERFRDIIHVRDVAEAWWRAAESPDALNQPFNVGTGRRTSVGELLALICERVPGAEYFVRGSTPGDQSGIYADNTRLRSILGLRDFTPLEEGLTEFIQWARQA